MKSGFVRFTLCLSLLLLASNAPVKAAEEVHLAIDTSKAGAKIDRNLFGQFAENLGHGLYEGIWVGPDSPIPNTRGIRNDVVTALRAIESAQCPLARRLLWRRIPLAQRHRPAGAAAGNAQFRMGWRGRHQQPSAPTNSWTFIQQIGSQAYVSINVGSGNSAGSGRVAGVHDCRATHRAG